MKIKSEPHQLTTTADSPRVPAVTASRFRPERSLACRYAEKKKQKKKDTNNKTAAAAEQEEQK